MKAFLLFLCCSIPSTGFCRTITLDIPDGDIKIVEHDVISAEDWIRNAWAGKLNNCKKRIAQEEIKKSVDASEALPAGQDAIIQKFMSRPEYKNRVERDAQEKANAAVQVKKQ